MRIIGASLGECVHIQGIWNALGVARSYGHETKFLGPAQSIERIIEVIKRESPSAVALSYRLTSTTGENILKEFSKRVQKEKLGHLDYLFGGTEPVAALARKMKFFDLVVDGSNRDQEIFLDYLRSDRSGKSDGNDRSDRDDRDDRDDRSDRKAKDKKSIPSQKIVERIKENDHPLLRTHFGLPSIKDTIEGIKKISGSGLIDIISLGTDQDAQENFFHPERQKRSRKGAGGVPVRSAEDFAKLYQATRRGNYPLMRTYAGTDELIKLAEVYEESFGNAWSAVPLFWFNDMDGRGPHQLEKSIAEHLELIKWSARHDKPVEILESHQWGMRWAHDTIQVAAAYLGADISKKLGVRDYIHQYMFHLPPENSFSNELAKMLAVKEMIKKLKGNCFTVYHQTRTGLPSFPPSLEAARGQLAASTMLQMQLSPDIIHVVNYSEPHHAATADDVINSAEIVRQVVGQAGGSPNTASDPAVQNRKEELKEEANFLLSYIYGRGEITDPKYLSSIVAAGLFDAPMLAGNNYARGTLQVGIINGACRAVDSKGKILYERQRIKQLTGSR